MKYNGGIEKMIKLTPYQERILEALKTISQSDNRFGSKDIRIVAWYLMIKPSSTRRCIRTLIEEGVIKRVEREIYQILATSTSSLEDEEIEKIEKVEKTVETEKKHREDKGPLRILETIELRPRYHKEIQIRISRLSQPLQVHEVDNHRAEYCFYREFCTDYAIKHQFSSFSCCRCPIFLSKRKVKIEVPN